MTDPATILKDAGLPVPEAVEAYWEWKNRRMEDTPTATYLADAALVALAEQEAELQAMVRLAAKELAWHLENDGEPYSNHEPRSEDVDGVLADLRACVREAE
jgi:hypothetical protein